MIPLGLDAATTVSAGTDVVSILGEMALVALSLGATYAFIALGYTMVYGIVKLVNFAHGEIFMVGAFAGLWVVGGSGLMQSVPYPAGPILAWIAAFLVAGLAAGTLAVLIERVAYRPLRGIRTPYVSASVLGALGLLLLTVPLPVGTGSTIRLAPWLENLIGLAPSFGVRATVLVVILAGALVVAVTVIGATRLLAALIPLDRVGSSRLHRPLGLLLLALPILAALGVLYSALAPAMSDSVLKRAGATVTAEAKTQFILGLIAVAGGLALALNRAGLNALRWMIPTTSTSPNVPHVLAISTPSTRPTTFAEWVGAPLPQRGSSGRIAALLTAVGVSLFLQDFGKRVFSPNPRGFPETQHVYHLDDLRPGQILDGELLLVDGSNVERVIAAWPNADGTRVAVVTEADLARIRARLQQAERDGKPLGPLYTPVEISVATKRTVILFLLAAGMIGLYWLVNYTRAGKAMRAVSYDRDAAKLMGINADRTIATTFFVGAFLAGMAGVHYGLINRVDPMMGFYPGLKAFVAAVIGGIGSIPGAVVGGFLLAGVEELVRSASRLAEMAGMPTDSGLVKTLREIQPHRDAVVFALLIVILVVKPTGLFGQTEGEKV